MYLITKPVLGASVRLPLFIVKGLLSAVFKGNMEVAGNWGSVAGKKMLVYSEDDHIIGYDASLHKALADRKALENTEVVKLGRLNSPDHHNVPLHVSLAIGPRCVTPLYWSPPHSIARPSFALSR